MTPAELRRLDALFAEKVMGWKNYLGGRDYWDYRQEPTSSLDAAWQGVDKIMRQSLFSCVFVLECDQGNGPDWDAAFIYPRDCCSIHHKAAIPALAVVKACLRAAGCSDEEIDFNG